MKFDDLLNALGEEPYFDFPTLTQLSREPRHALRVQLYRWLKRGRIVGLRRGLYTFANQYRKTPLIPEKLANDLYKPSYLSGIWALGFYEMIPEMVVTYTSVTTRAPRRFENTFGIFEYRHLKQDLFFGYHSVIMHGVNVLVAYPEKALLDFIYLSGGEWTVERILEMRFQNSEIIRFRRLNAFARKFDSKRLNRTLELWRKTVKREEEAYKKL